MPSNLGFLTDPLHDLEKLAIEPSLDKISIRITFVSQGNCED